MPVGDRLAKTVRGGGGRERAWRQVDQPAAGEQTDRTKVGSYDSWALSRKGRNYLAAWGRIQITLVINDQGPRYSGRICKAA